jgi:hypothetical protein
MRRVTLGFDADPEEVATRLRSALRPGAEVVFAGDRTIAVRRGPVRRCVVAFHQTPDGAAIEVYGDAGGVPLPLAAAVLRWVGERTVASEVAAALQASHGDPGPDRDRAP